MSAPSSFSLTSHSPDQTAKFAVSLAGALRAGDTICLTGGLGAGKSHFARSIIRHLTDETDIPSPTFTLVQTYNADGYEIWHADLYRLSAPEELTELGMEDAFGQALCLIEWPDRLVSPPPAALWIEILTGEIDDIRRLVFTHGGEWHDRLADVRSTWVA